MLREPQAAGFPQYTENIPAAEMTAETREATLGLIGCSRDFGFATQGVQG